MSSWTTIAYVRTPEYYSNFCINHPVIHNLTIKKKRKVLNHSFKGIVSIIGNLLRIRLDISPPGTIDYNYVKEIQNT